MIAEERGDLVMVIVVTIVLLPGDVPELHCRFIVAVCGASSLPQSVKH